MKYVLYGFFVLYLIFLLFEKVYLHSKKNRDKNTNAFSWQAHLALAGGWWLHSLMSWSHRLGNWSYSLRL